MDAHDLFKKLTKGAIFTKKKKEVLNIEKQDSRILKEEPKKLEQHLGDSEDYSQADFDESEEDEGITLLAGFDKATGEKIKKKKNNISESNKEAQLHKEHINRIRNEHHINVNGKSPVEPIVNFTELNEKYKVSQKLLDNLTKCGYSQPTPIQMQAMPVLINERNIMGCAPTGSGKTAAFLVPIIHQLKQPMKQGFRCVILCPTRELASQTKRECERLTESIGLRVFSIDKISQAENKFGPNSNKKFDILVTTPNRICHLLDMDRPILDLSNVKWLVLDEADKLFEEGLRSFREQFDKIYLACSKQDKVVALLSATWTQSVSKWCQSHLKRLLTITIGQRNSVTEQVEQELLFVGTESGKLLAIRDIIRKGVHPPVLVFVQSKDRAQQLFKELIYDGINVDVIHADRTQQQRDNCVRSFREGKIWVLICTELMGRGIDFKGVNLVINYDFPQSAISYIHRIGRTGRAGRKGKAITFFTKEDTTNLRRIAQLMKDSGCHIPEYMLSLKKHSKKERRKLEKFAPERDDITTNPKILAKNAKEKAAKRPAADKLKKNKSKMLKLSNEDD